MGVLSPKTFVITGEHWQFESWIESFGENWQGDESYVVFCEDKPMPTRGRKRVRGDRIFVLEPCRPSFRKQAIEALLPCGFQEREVMTVIRGKGRQ